MRVFIEVNIYTYISICVFFLKNTHMRMSLDLSPATNHNGGSN
jgi:hypothetical protein